MKRAILLSALLASLLLLSAAHAELAGDYCTVGSVGVNVKYDTSAHVKMTYYFACEGEEEDVGQLTRMLIKLPLGSVQNVKASDSYGELDVLEGPDYVKAVSTVDETNIGVMFRKGLLITMEEKKYPLTIEFDAPTLVKVGENDHTLEPGVLAADPSTVIVTNGITTTRIPVSEYDFKLELYDANIKEVSPSVCEIKESDITCSDLDKEKFEEVKIKWGQEASPTQEWSERIKDYTKRYVPTIGGTIKKLFSGLLDSISSEEAE